MKFLLSVVAFYATQVVFASEQYVVGITWQDSTTQQEDYKPVYDADCRGFRPLYFQE